MAHDMMFCQKCKTWVFYTSEWDVTYGCCDYCAEKIKEARKAKKNEKNKESLELSLFFYFILVN